MRALLAVPFLAACAARPAVDAPALVPLGPVLAAADALPAGAPFAAPLAAEGDALAARAGALAAPARPAAPARAAALRARAAALRGAVLTPEERATLDAPSLP